MGCWQAGGFNPSGGESSSRRWWCMMDKQALIDFFVHEMAIELGYRGGLALSKENRRSQLKVTMPSMGSR